MSLWSLVVGVVAASAAVVVVVAVAVAAAAAAASGVLIVVGNDGGGGCCGCCRGCGCSGRWLPRLRCPVVVVAMVVAKLVVIIVKDLQRAGRMQPRMRRRRDSDSWPRLAERSSQERVFSGREGEGEGGGGSAADETIMRRCSFKCFLLISKTAVGCKV